MLLERLRLRLSRITTSGRLLPEVDGIRFVAIAAVVAFHLQATLVDRPRGVYASALSGDWLYLATAHARHGVELFFTLSGFILGLPFARAARGGTPVSLRAYYLRRVTRLEPPYLAALLGAFVLVCVVRHVTPGTLFPHLLASSVYAHNAIYGDFSLVHAAAWSLEIEVQFYVLAPWLARAYRIESAAVRRTLLAGVAALFVVLQRSFIDADPRLHLSLLGYAQFFLLGMLLADVYVADWREAPRDSRLWDGVALVAWPLLPVVWSYPVLLTWAFPVVAVVACASALRGTVARRLFSLPWIVTIGGMCYSIYLVHADAVWLGRRIASDLPFASSFWAEFLLQGVVAVPVALLASAVFFVLIERPCMRPDWPLRVRARWIAWFRRSGPAVTPGDGR